MNSMQTEEWLKKTLPDILKDYGPNNVFNEDKTDVSLDVFLKGPLPSATIGHERVKTLVFFWFTCLYPRPLTMALVHNCEQCMTVCMFLTCSNSQHQVKIVRISL